MTFGIYWPFLVYSLLAFGIIGVILVVSYVLGERHKDTTIQRPYESGMLPTGSSHFRYSVTFYLVAMFFVLFDVESLFIFAWAIRFRDLAWPGYIEIVIFISILLAGLVYLWKLGALDWGTRPQKRI